MPNDAVTVAYVHPNEITHSWQQSLLGLLQHDLSNHARVARGGWLAVRCYGSDGIAGARETAVAQFLAEKDADWLFWIDTDMGFAPDTVDRLLEVADPVERPIVGALCFAQKQHGPDGLGGWHTSLVPTIYDWTTVESGESGFLSRADYPVNTLVRCAGTGSACILIHRSVLERMVEQFKTCYTRVPNPTAGGRLLGEDLSFCMRAGAMSLPVFVHTGVRTTHFKPSWLSEQDFWRRVRPEPADEHVAVIVPVMKRPQNAGPFMRSLRASTGLARVFAVADADDTDTAKAWCAAGAEVLVMPEADRAGTFAEKANYGYRCITSAPTKLVSLRSAASEEAGAAFMEQFEEQLASAPYPVVLAPPPAAVHDGALPKWLFIVGDDVQFHAGWLDHAQHTAKATGADVVGTNDLGNPRVISGEHATHLLISLAYIEQQGASWDGPGVVCHEGYRHWYVDDEIVTAAKQRGVWASSLGSIVEHMHPLFGKADDDEVYRIGQRRSGRDAAVFRDRLKASLEVSSAS